MNSMTGYGCSNATFKNTEISIEITSVNRRSLEVISSLPQDWQGLEHVILAVVRKKIGRGKISVYVKAKDLRQSSGLVWNEKAIKGALDKLKALSEIQGINYEVKPDLVFSVAKSLTNFNELPEVDAVREVFTKILEAALDKFLEMKATEGTSLSKDIQERVALLAKYLDLIKSKSGDAIPRQRKLFIERLEKADITIDLDDERILKEIAIFADRCDISEEITRLESHFAQFSEECEAKSPIGRKLDFLCQEVNREFNTIGSKTNLIDITRAVIESKNELERIREQVQNIE